MKKLFLFMFFLLAFCQPINAYEKTDAEVSEDVPGDIKIYFELAGKAFDICPELLEAIAYHESRYTPTSKNGLCYGLMQINVNVHKNRIKSYGWTKEDMLDPLKNIVVSADLLHDLYEIYGDDGAVLAAYSGNYKGITSCKKNGVLCDYAKDILERSYELEELHGKHDFGRGEEDVRDN